MTAPVLKFEQRGAVAVITIYRPEAMNSFNLRLREELLTAFRRVADDTSVRVVVLTGEGRSFSAGADLKEVSADQGCRGDAAGRVPSDPGMHRNDAPTGDRRGRGFRGRHRHVTRAGLRFAGHGG